jgi:hypothetical protein
MRGRAKPGPPKLENSSARKSTTFAKASTAPDRRSRPSRSGCRKLVVPACGCRRPKAPAPPRVNRPLATRGGPRAVAHRPPRVRGPSPRLFAARATRPRQKRRWHARPGRRPSDGLRAPVRPRPKGPLVPAARARRINEEGANDGSTRNHDQQSGLLPT